MGMNSSKALNMVETGISASVAAALENSAACNTTVSGSNIISIVRGNGINISDVKQKVYIKVNTSCVVTQVSDAKMTQTISEKLQQQAESVTTGLGMNAAESENFMHIMTRLSTAVQTSMVAEINAVTSGTNSITIVDSSNVTATVIDQEFFNDTVTKNVVAQSMSTSVGQEAQVAIEQAAKAKAEGFNLSLGLIVFIVAAIVGSIFIVSWKNTVTTVLMNPMTWMLVTTPILIGSAVLFIAGMPKTKIFWPYEKAVSSDTETEASNKRSKNATILLAAGVSTVMLLVLDAGLFYATIKSYGAMPKGQQPRSGTRPPL